MHVHKNIINACIIKWVFAILIYDYIKTFENIKISYFYINL